MQAQGLPKICAPVVLFSTCLRPCEQRAKPMWLYSILLHIQGSFPDVKPQLGIWSPPCIQKNQTQEVCQMHAWDKTERLIRVEVLF